MSTRRARIKAVTTLPPRRKNVDNAASKKKQEDAKEGFESGINNKPGSARRQSLDKTIKEQQASLDGSTQEEKKGFEVGVSPSKRRLSVDKTQGRRRLSIDKAATEACENDTKTPKARRISLDKTPKRRTSIDKTATKCLAVETITLDAKTVKKSAVSVKTDSTNLSDKTSKETCIKPDIESWFPKILKNLLNSNDKSPKNMQSLISPGTNKSTLNLATESNVKGIDKVPYECNPSTSKVKECNEIMKPIPVPLFASPRVRASPRRPSPIVRTPVIEVDLTAEKCIAPHKGPNSVCSERDYIESNTSDVNQNSANSEVEVTVERVIDNNIHESNETVVNWAPTKKSKYPVKIIDEYVIKPTPETSPVMDGIVPLQPITKAPKPLDLLKNEIISENAEVLFDPIVPLPSPGKVRPKLRPVPRLGPRRNSFQQGSASESEDENRRLHGRPATPATPIPSRQRNDSHTSHATTIVQRDVARVRNDSVCSTVSQAPSHSAAVGSPMREREKSLKSRREEMAARRNAAIRRKQVEVERDKLTMYDLIFYNPKGKPIIPDQDEIKAKEANKKEEDDRKAEVTKDSKIEPALEAAPAAVPQIKLGPNGEIILDEQSLVVNQSDQRKLESSVVREGAWGGSGSRAYRRTPRTAEWTNDETVRFYRAIAALGTDFTLMQPLFPTRTRRDLKLKFKKEERMNLAQVDKALRSGALWDPMRLEAEFTAERQAAEEAAKKAKERLKREKEEEKERERDMKNLRKRRSKCSKTLGDSAMPKRFSQSKIAPSTLDEYVKYQEERASNKKLSKKRKANELPSVSMTSLEGVIVSTPSVPPPGPALATLTLVDRRTKLRQITPQKPPAKPDLAIITKEVSLPVMPTNIETGSLVVLTVNDPKSPSRKMLQTYIAQGPGNLAPVSLPANFLNSVVGFMNTPVSTVVGANTKSKPPNIVSPRKRTSSHTIPTANSTGVAKTNTPNILSRKRTTSYTITQL